MRYRSLGRTGVQVSEIGLGGNTFGAAVDASGTAAIVAKALDLGINFIDSAESYSNGKSEELLGKALASRRHEVILATKTGAPNVGPAGRLTRRSLIERLEASLHRIGTDYIDLYYFHMPDPSTPREESLRAADDLIRSGKVRYLGCSNYAAWEVADLVGISERKGYSAPVASQMAYNLIDRAIESEMLPACAHFGLSLVPYSPLAAGFLTGKYRRDGEPPAGSRFAKNERVRAMRLTEANFAKLDRYTAFATQRGRAVGDLAIAWLLASPTVCSVIAGATSPAQLEEHVRAADWSLGPDDLSELA